MTLCRGETRRKRRRTNGLQTPWHPQQVAGWLVLAAFGSCSFGVLLPGLGPDLYPVALFVLGSLFFLHVVSHVAALLIDPADPQLRRAAAAADSAADGTTTVVPELDKSKHAHVIENGKCHLCNIYTSGRRTKHCGSCNKCVEKFDHHCKWLNHCVGARNYVAFVVSVVSASLACLVIAVVASAELVLVNADPAAVGQYLSPVFGPSNDTAAAAVRAHRLFNVDRVPVERGMFVIIAGTQCAMALVAMVLLLHLCAFHVYISALGITTYEYIRNYRRYPEFDSRNGGAPPSSHHRRRPGERSSLAAKLYASACCYGAAGRRRQRPSCGIHSNNVGGGAADMAVETVEESYGRGAATAAGGPSKDSLLLQQRQQETAADPQRRQSKCRYCAEKNNRIRSGGDGGAFFVLDKRRKGLCCCFRKPEPVFGVGDEATMLQHHHRRVKVPPSPFAVRRNRVIPSSDDDGGGPAAVTDRWNKPFDSNALPALSRPVQKITLKELGQVLAFVEQQPSARHMRRKIGGSAAGSTGGCVVGSQMKQSKSSSNLSPIHESGLSNPSTPQLKNRYPQTRPCSWLSSAVPHNNSSQTA